jgi:hypothetical protein
MLASYYLVPQKLLLKSNYSYSKQIRLGMALKASNVVGNPVTLHRIW